ncbi:MAG: flagellar basal body-associated FliL family protein [Gammaproteobacteria bacterium]|nr:flagellar basal body-associated FliL family protein [Gammaproteobacteria bacterium]
MSLFRVICIIAGLTLNFNISAEEKGSADGNGDAPAKSLYLSLKPAFVVNVTEGSRVRHMQIQLQVKYTQPEIEGYLVQHDPAIRHEMVMLFSGMPVSEVKTVSGKQKMMAEALAAIQKVLLDNINNTGVDAVYFTDLVIQ